MEKTYYIGLDVGSTTAKIAVIDSDNRVIYSKYERHNARVNELVSQYFDEILALTGDAEARICVTGSVGMATAEQLQAEFVQEVVAASVYARTAHPEAKALIDIGGEDAKVIFFKKNGNMELRMNGNCAGGTGAFIDQMSVLMGVENQKMSELAMKAEHVYPMAARCGVFAKTDIQNLMARNLPEADIAASIFHSIAVQTVVTLSHGISFEAPILLCGGPLTFLPALRKAFCDYLHLSPNDFIVSGNSNLIPALGCAYRAKSADSAASVSALRSRMKKEIQTEWTSSLLPLFKNEKEHQEWLKSKAKFATETKPLNKGKQQVVIGIDSGSTTTKIVAVRVNAETPTGDIVFTNYRLNLGNPIKAVADGLNTLKQEAALRGAELEIVGSCSTGYGEELIKAAFGLDSGIIETMAHERAAASLMPDVSFILDIGGQDMKAIFVEKGAVVRMELNEACSSGCGTFIQTFANNMGYSVGDFAQLACQSKAPCDLGTRCTVFMNSKVKQVLREGASVADISAGISYSVIKNCLYKVLKLHGNENLGGKIVVQGGTMRNDAVVRAFELLTHTEVARSNMPELMGAYGCALHAAADYKHRTSAEDEHPASSRSIDDLQNLAHYETKQLQCKGCENHCYVSRYTFAGGNRFYSGNKCERVFNNKGANGIKGKNIYEYKYSLLFDRETVNPPATAFHGTWVGIPRILNMYEEYPFWNALLRAAGLGVILSSDSTFSQYEGALNTVMSDNICFPAKLAHSHLKELNENPKVDRILMPYVVYEHNDDPKNTLNSFNCPVVSGYSDVIKSVINLKKPIDTPVINFAQPKALEKQITDYLKQLGVSKKTAHKALREALYAQAVYTAEIKKQGWEILKNEETEAQKTDETKTQKPNKGLTILLAGRPYHTDPLIQHKLSEMIANLGVNVISEDIARGNLFADFKEFNLEDLAAERNEAALASQDNNEAYNCQPETYLVKQWAYMNRILKAAQWAAEQGDEVHFVQMTSFGCGPDSFIQDEIRDIMKRHNKPFTLLKIDDVSNIGSLKLRVRSLIESLKGVKEVKSEERRVKNSSALSTSSAAYADQADAVEVKAGGRTYRFAKKDGRLLGVEVGGKAISLSNGPRFMAARRSDRSLDQFYNHDDKEAEKKKTLYTEFVDQGAFVGFEWKESEAKLVATYQHGSLDEVDWQFLSDGSVAVTCHYNFGGVVDMMGMAFDYPESKVRSKAWVGNGPYRVWQNREQGPQYGYWQNDYNDPIPAESWDYPEFKGYFANVKWMQFKTDEGKIGFSGLTADEHMGVYTPRDGRDGLLYTLPQTGLAVFKVIPSVRNKVNTTDLNGPSAQPKWLNGKGKAVFTLNFEL